jgi:hypothetical protein
MNDLKTRSKIKRISFCLSLLFFLTTLPTCAKNFEVDGSIGSSGPLFRESASSSFIPESDQVLSDCALRDGVCLYFKNPVFQAGEVVAPFEEEKLKSLQSFRAQLTGLDQSGFVKNSFLNVQSVSQGPLKLSEALKTHGIDSHQQMALSLNAYYWLNRAHEYLNKNFKDVFSFEKPVDVYVDDAFDGWSLEKKALYLSASKKSALSADVLLILWAEAQMGFATEGKINQPSSFHHAACGDDPVGCCKDKTGCSQALLHGSADALHALLFEDAPEVGAFYHQSLSGQSICGKKARSPEAFKDLSFQQAYDLCPEKPGSTVAMGMAYAAVWWKASHQASDPKKVLKVFLKSLPQMTGEDTFSSASTKIIETCKTLGFPELIPLF